MGQMGQMRHAKKEGFNVFDGLLIGTLVALAFLAAIQAGSAMQPGTVPPQKELAAGAGTSAAPAERGWGSALLPAQGEERPADVVQVCESPAPALTPIEQRETAKGGAAAVKTAFSARRDIPLSPEFQEYVVKKCEKEQIDSNLVYAIMWHETRFQSDLISKTDDYGLMQINRQAHFSELQRRYGITDMKQMLEPYRNAEYGIELIASLVERYGVEKGLAAYKCGEAGMKANLRRGYIPVDVADMMAKAGEYRAAEEGRA